MSSSRPVVYGKPGCVQCQFTTKVLTSLKIPYDYVDVTSTPAAEEHVRSLGYSALPVVETPQGHWAGFKPDRIREIT